MPFLKKRTVKAGLSMAVEKARYLVIDTELTGLDEKKDSIVSIGAVRMEGGRIGMGDSSCRLINPVLVRAGIKSTEDPVKISTNFKGGDDRRFRYESFAVLCGAIENVSSITGMNHAREVTGRAHELCGGKVIRFLVPAGRH